MKAKMRPIFDYRPRGQTVDRDTERATHAFKGGGLRRIRIGVFWREEFLGENWATATTGKQQHPRVLRGLIVETNAGGTRFLRRRRDVYAPSDVLRRRASRRRQRDGGCCVVQIVQHLDPAAPPVTDPVATIRNDGVRWLKPYTMPAGKDGEAG